MMKVVMMILLLVPTVTIVLSTASVHAADRMIPSSMLSKAAQREHTFRHLLNPPTLAVKQQSRFLQNGTGASPTPAPESSQCVTFKSEDFFNYEICICEEESNMSDIVAKLQQIDVTDPSEFTLAYNTLIGEVKESFDRTCQTPCEECFTQFNSSGLASKFCGLFNSDNSLDAQYVMGNFTFEDIANGRASNFTDLVVGTYRYEECFQYTGDQFSNSEICATYVNEVDSDSDVLYCNITYNDLLCNSCAVLADEEECFVADCTNVNETYATMIDLCQNVGANGPFQIFFVLQEANNATFTAGSCDVNVPEGAPSSQVKAPAAASPTNNKAPTSIGDGSASTFPLTYIAFAITSIAMFRNFN